MYTHCGSGRRQRGHRDAGRSAFQVTPREHAGLVALGGSVSASAAQPVVARLS